MFTRMKEVDIESVGIHVTELVQGFEDESHPVKKVERVPIPPRQVSSYWSNLLWTPAEPRCSAYLNLILDLNRANPLGTLASLIIIHFSPFPRVSFLPKCECQPFSKRGSTGLRKGKLKPPA